MLNVVAVQAEIEYRQQQRLQEAETHRRSRLARPSGRGNQRRIRLARLRTGRSAARAA